jgi:sulfur carrier protein ThiS
VIALKNLLESVSFSLKEDCWRLLPDEEGEFSVKSTYKSLLEDLEFEEEVQGVLVQVLDQI